MFSVTTACALDENAEGEADDAAARYYAKVDRRRQQRRAAHNSSAAGPGTSRTGATTVDDVERGKRRQIRPVVVTSARPRSRRPLKRPGSSFSPKSGGRILSPSSAALIPFLRTPVAIGLLTAGGGGGGTVGGVATPSSPRKRFLSDETLVDEGGVFVDDSVGGRAHHWTSCRSLLLLNRSVCCAPIVRSRSNEEESMFTFLRSPRSMQCILDKEYLEVPQHIDNHHHHHHRRDSTRSELHHQHTPSSPLNLSNTAPMATSDDLGLGGGNGGSRFGQNRTMLLDLDTPETKLNTATLTTSASNGGLEGGGNGGGGGGDGMSDQTRTPVTPSFDIVTINVTGMRYQTYVGTLERFPDTLLGDPMKRASYFNATTGEYFFDRHRASFDAIMYYYQSDGRKLCRPESVPPDIFLNELQFFEMGRKVIDRFLESQGYVRAKEVALPKNDLQRRICLLVEHPDSSMWARIVAFFSVFVIIISTLSFCLETIPELKYTPSRNHSEFENGTLAGGGGGGGDEAESFDNPFFVIELSCMCWFTLEFILRFGSCPSKLVFCKSFLNIIDFVAIVPFFVNLAWASARGAGGSTPPFGVLRIFRLVRVFRIFKLSRHSRGLQILGKTFTASVQELCLLIFFLVIGLVLFSSAVYIAESGYESGFDSIPASFWFVIVTMTTVGYGDLTPIGPWGKLVGGMCAITGVLVLALPVPVIVANFKHYYRQEARLARMKAAEDEGVGGDDLDDESRSS